MMPEVLRETHPLVPWSLKKLWRLDPEPIPIDIDELNQRYNL